jgi:hypothetical protein
VKGFMHAGVAIVHLLAGRFDDASSTAEKAFRDFPRFLIVVGTMAASHALAGRADEARRAMDSSAPARPRTAHLQSARFAAAASAAGSGLADGWPARVGLPE